MSADFSTAECELIQRVIHARRDIRKFKSDPISQDILLRILRAAHAAPSVGFMQPWNFILIDSLPIRTQIKESFDGVTNREAEKFQKQGRGDLYKSLKLEGILESPLNIAVTCDYSRYAPGSVLGRDPMPQTAPYSVCLAIENLWLAARAEGIGVGWVSILDAACVKSALNLPEKVELIAYLCVGYPQEFRPLPLLEEVGWKKRDELRLLTFGNQWGQPSNLFPE
jgi:5,6-dimethylbenzimidazole synthase